MKRTGPSNTHLQTLIKELKTQAITQDVSLWKRIAVELEKPTRQRRAVNLSRINRHTKDAELIIVPGKVLGSGSLDHKITISAWSFSDGALEKLKQQQCEVLTIRDLLKKNPKGQKVRILG